MDEDTEPMPMGQRRQRKLIRFDPTVSAGTLVHVVSLMLLAAGGWATYQSDRATNRMELDQIKANAAATNLASKEAITELKQDVREVQKTITSVDKTLNGIKAEIDAKKGQKP